MITVRFTENLRRHIHAPTTEVEASSLKVALDQVFTANPGLRSYILDDQGRVRKHVAVFVNGDLLKDKTRLDLPLKDSDEIDVIQALSGG